MFVEVVCLSKERYSFVILIDLSSYRVSCSSPHVHLEWNVPGDEQNASVFNPTNLAKTLTSLA